MESIFYIYNIKLAYFYVHGTHSDASSQLFINFVPDIKTQGRKVALTHPNNH